MSINGSVYPPAVEDLVPRVAALAQEIGEIPSRNRIMKEFKVGSPKASAVRDALVTDPGLVSPTVDDEDQPVEEPTPLVATVGHPEVATTSVTAVVAPSWWPFRQQQSAAAPRAKRRRVRVWPVAVIALPAAVAIWSGWVGLGEMTGFGVVHPLPGIADDFALNTAITLPIGVEAYAAFALGAWLSGAKIPARAREFARWSGIASLVVGMLGQVAYHLFVARGLDVAPEAVTTAVSCLPVVVLGMATALAHLLRSDDDEDDQA